MTDEYTIDLLQEEYPYGRWRQTDATRFVDRNNENWKAWYIGAHLIVWNEEDNAPFSVYNPRGDYWSY